MTREDFIEYMRGTAEAAGKAEDFDREALRKVLNFEPTMDAFYDVVNAGAVRDAEHLDKTLGRLDAAIDDLELDRVQRGAPHAAPIFSEV